MLERETPLNYVKDEIPASPSLNVSSDVLMKTVTLAEFLIPLLTENPEKSEYYRKVTPKGVRTNFFYVTVCSLQMTMGLTLKRETRQNYIQLQHGKCFLFIKMMLISDKCYYNKRIARNCYTRVDVPLEETISVPIAYGQSQIFPSYKSCN